MRTETTTQTPSKKTRRALWTIQAILALLFLFAGGTKLLLPLAALAQQSPLPGAFLRFIGLCEVAGALGLVLPGLLRIRPGLTALAAAGLTIIMIGAVGATMATGHSAPAIFPGLVAVLAATVAHGRRSRPQPTVPRTVELQAA